MMARSPASWGSLVFRFVVEYWVRIHSLPLQLIGLLPIYDHSAFTGRPINVEEKLAQKCDCIK